MRRIKIITIASTKRMWIKPPIVYELTKPKTQSTRSITAIVQSILLVTPLFLFFKKSVLFSALYLNKRYAKLQM